MAHNGTNNGDLTPPQEAVALALARGRSIRRAAEDCQAGDRTVKPALAVQLALARRVRALRAEMTQAALGLLLGGLAEAADTLRGLPRARSEQVGLGAGRALFELGMKLRDQAELEG